ncbi:GtrA family protein [Enterovibrio sp. FF113]|uniref:GtrA family protein n=1 Tax=Enterovibrio TaxID=188143 RepID=UPI00352C971D
MVGCFNTANSYLTFLLLYKFIENINISLLISYVWAMCVSYLLNKYYVFGSGSGSVFSFLLVNISLFLLNRGLLEAALVYTKLPIEIVQALSLLFLSVLSYLSYSKIFRK